MTKYTILYIFVFNIVLSSIESASISEYLHFCKRDPDTINECLIDAIHDLKPQLAKGIPDLKLPPMEPLIIPELVVDQGNVIRFKAVGKDIKVTGVNNFKIKSLDIDLDNLVIKEKVYFPRLEFDGKYDLDARLLTIPLHGKGNIQTNATKCYAELVIQCKLEDKNDKQYLKIEKVDMDVDVQDYSVRITNLFNGDQQADDVANQILNQNKGEFLRASKPFIERTCSNLFKKIGNRILGSYTFDEILPLP